MANFRDPAYPKKIGGLQQDGRVATLLAESDGFVLYSREGIFVPKTPNLAKFRLPASVFHARYSQAI